MTLLAACFVAAAVCPYFCLDSFCCRVYYVHFANLQSQNFNSICEEYKPEIVYLNLNECFLLLRPNCFDPCPFFCHFPFQLLLLLICLVFLFSFCPFCQLNYFLLCCLPWLLLLFIYNRHSLCSLLFSSPLSLSLCVSLLL